MGFNALTRTIALQTIKLKKNSPTVLFAVGIVAVGTGTVLACRATLRLENVLDEHHKTIDDINELPTDSPRYTESDRTKDRVIAYGDTAVQLVQLYGPAVVIGTVGIACLTKSHGILTKRNAALTAAYAGLERSYNAYRRIVREEIGEDAERNLHYRSQEKELQRTQIAREENPKKRGPNMGSMYAIFFDKTNPNWRPSATQNKTFLRAVQQSCNDRLQARGFLLLNEVYEALGAPLSSAGSVVGWVYVSDGDGFVDFGIFDPKSEGARLFVNGWEDSVLLDFNVDGQIYQQIDRYRYR